MAGEILQQFHKSADARNTPTPPISMLNRTPPNTSTRKIKTTPTLKLGVWGWAFEQKWKWSSLFCCNISPANFGIVVECTKIIVCTLMKKCAKFGLHRLPKKHILHPYVCPKSKDCETHGQTDCCHSVIEYLTACKCQESRKVHTNLRATFRPLLTPFLFARARTHNTVPYS